MRHFNAGKKIDYRKFAVFVFRPGAETYPLPFRKPGGGGMSSACPVPEPAGSQFVEIVCKVVRLRARILGSLAPEFDDQGVSGSGRIRVPCTEYSPIDHREFEDPLLILLLDGYCRLSGHRMQYLSLSEYPYPLYEDRYIYWNLRFHLQFVPSAGRSISPSWSR